jgi:hypothetical protein
MEFRPEGNRGGVCRCGIGIRGGPELFEAREEVGEIFLGEMLPLLGKRVPERGEFGSGAEEFLGVGEEPGLNANALLKVFEEGVKASLFGG